MIKFFKDLFSKKSIKPVSLLYIDGDNGCNKSSVTSFCKPDIGWKYIWVQNKNACTPRYLEKLPVEIIHPSNFGKESTDTFIAMDIVNKCATGNVKEVVIQTCDMDFLDVCVNAAKMFPLVSFCLMVNRAGSGIKKVDTRKLPSNVKRLIFKTKPVIAPTPKRKIKSHN